MILTADIFLLFWFLSFYSGLYKERETSLKISEMPIRRKERGNNLTSFKKKGDIIQDLFKGSVTWKWYFEILVALGIENM